MAIRAADSSWEKWWGLEGEAVKMFSYDDDDDKDDDDDDEIR